MTTCTQTIHVLLSLFLSRCDRLFVCRSIQREVAGCLVGDLAAVPLHRLPAMLYWAAGINDLSRSRVDQVSSALKSDFDITDVPAVLPVVPLLPSAIQLAFKYALKEALDDQNDDEDAFDYLYYQFIDRETTRNKKVSHHSQLHPVAPSVSMWLLCAQEAAERRRLEAEIQRLRNENAMLKEQVSWIFVHPATLLVASLM